MRIPIYQVAAFTSEVFSGNPAAVCLLDTWLDDKQLQCIAAENNLSETAFLVGNDHGFELRWFTPVTEVALCGHATLASAFVVFTRQKWSGDSIPFQTRKSGTLTVTERGHLFEMDFPARPVGNEISPAEVKEALGVTPARAFDSAEDLMVVLENENAVRGVQPNFGVLERLEWRGTIVTAKGDRSDFVSRFFAPRVGVQEDPVTGSAHCVLTPYWAMVLGKNDLHAYQVSKRGGELFCTHAGKRVRISGEAVLYMEGAITI
jgi:PhzF family phenazine biosynthesis protein